MLNLIRLIVLRISRSYLGRFILLLTVLSLAGCAHDKSPYAEFKHKSAQEIFQGGEKALAKGNYKDAVKHFEALDALYPFGRYEEQGQLDIIYAYYKNDDLASAFAAADRYIHLYPRGRNVDYAYYLKGVINFGRGTPWLQKVFSVDASQRELSYARQSFIDFNELTQRFPNSLYAADAHKRMLYIRNLLAKYEINVAEFYMKKKAYVAAANRASYVVEHFESAPQVIDALGIMVNAYRKLGADKQASDALQVLKQNYPDSAVYKSLANE